VIWFSDNRSVIFFNDLNHISFYFISVGGGWSKRSRFFSGLSSDRFSFFFEFVVVVFAARLNGGDRVPFNLKVS
jgi:hypothetical protein